MRSRNSNNAFPTLRYVRASRHGARLTIVIAVVAALGGCMSAMHPPSNLDYGRARTSESGKYRAAFRPDGDSIPQGKLQKWTLHLETATGVPVDDATVTVDGGMPQHGHGLPTKPVVTRRLGSERTSSGST